MSRALALKQKQVTALCKGAAKAGFVPVVEVAGTRVLLVPDNHAIVKGLGTEAVDDDEEIRL